MSEAPKLSQVIRLDSLPLNQTYFTPEGYLMAVSYTHLDYRHREND